MTVKIKYLNKTEAMKEVERYFTLANGNDWRIIVQQVGEDFRVQWVQVQNKK